MSTQGVNVRDGGNYVANSDLSAKQFYAVKQTTTPRALDLASTGGEAITGIVQNAPKQGDAVDVAMFGLCKALIGTGGVTAGDALQTEAATGKLITKTSTNIVVAIAVETIAAGAIGLVRVVSSNG